MKGKKSLLAVVFLVIIGVNCYGANDFKILTRPDINIKTAFVLPTRQSLRNESPAFSSSIGIDFYSLYADASYYLNVYSSDTVLSFFTTPLSLNWFEMGIGFKYHLYDYFESFCENDFLFNQFYAFMYKDILRFQINTGYDLKLTCFKHNKDLVPIFYQSIFIGFNFAWNINKIVKIYLGANSMSDFNFSLIGTPFYNLGLDLRLKENLTIGCNYEMQMTDMFAVVENITEMLFIMYMKVSL